MMKIVKKIIKNSNENLKKKNWTVSKNIEIPYNKAKIINHTHLTLAINHACCQPTWKRKTFNGSRQIIDLVLDKKK